METVVAVDLVDEVMVVLYRVKMVISKIEF